jgi:CRP/FNR family cyclic AMP-dependent transcriptional regulator
MSQGALGRVYEAGEIVFRQGEIGDCLFVVQAGEVEVVAERDGVETRLSTVGKDQLLGEMAVFERQARSATVRAIGQARLLTIDKKNFLRRINEDPSLAFRIVETMSRRIRNLSDEVVELRSQLRAAGRTTG